MAVKLPTKTYHQHDFTTKLRVPEGIQYVEPRYYDDALEALRQGMALYVESCDGRGFFWTENGKAHGDIFFYSDASQEEYDSLEDAADRASLLCEGATEGD